MFFFFKCRQPHKHVQAVPLPFKEIGESKFEFGTEIFFDTFQNEKEIFTIPEFKFRHACVNLFLTENSSVPVEKVLHSKYLSLMEHLKLPIIYGYQIKETDDDDTLNVQSYNFLMTKKFMLMVPRIRDNCEFCPSITANSITFSGTILAKAQEDIEYIKSIGVEKLLEQITFPI